MVITFSAVPQLAFVSESAGQDRAVLQHRRPVVLAGSDQDDGRVAMRLSAAHAHELELVRAGVNSELSRISPAAGIEGAVLCQHDRPAVSERSCHRQGGGSAAQCW